MNNKNFNKKIKRLKKTGAHLPSFLILEGEKIVTRDIIDTTHCHNCGAHIAAASPFHGYCNQCISNVEICPDCGEKSIVEIGSNFECLSCGEKHSFDVFMNRNQIQIDADNNMAIFTDGKVYKLNCIEHDPDSGVMGKFVGQTDYFWKSLNSLIS